MRRIVGQEELGKVNILALAALDQVGFHAFGFLVRVAVDDVVDLFQDLSLHLIGGHVGESDGKNLTEVLRRGLTS